MKLEDLRDDADHCQVCGKALPNDCYWGIRKYCSKNCNSKAYRQRNLDEIRRMQRRKQRRRRQAEVDAMPPRHCAGCGSVIPGWTRSDKKWCTPLCRHLGRPLGNGICEGCGATFKPWGTVKRYCTPECQKKAWYARKDAEAGIVREGRTCIGCGAPIPAASRTDRQWCSRVCYRARKAKV